MPRKRKIPDAAEFDVPRKRLWQWLQKHADAKTQGVQGEPETVRRGVIQRLNFAAKTSGDPSMARVGAVAGALLDLDAAAADRATAKWYLELRADMLDKASLAAQAVEALRKGWMMLEERAKADRPALPLMMSYWPESIVLQLAARDMALTGAVAFIDDYRGVVERMGENVWGADIAPGVLRKIDSIALHLSEGGFSPSEIATLLDETSDRAELKVDRWRKRVAWARKALQRSMHGAPISSADVPAINPESPHAATAPTPDSASPPRRRARRNKG